jgi:hypothetical protein
MFSFPDPRLERLHAVKFKGGFGSIHLPKQNAKRVDITFGIVRLFQTDLYKYRRTQQNKDGDTC